MSGELHQRPFGRVIRPYKPIEVLSADHVAALHETALKVLRDIGMRVLEDNAREKFRVAGARIDGDNVRLDPAMVAEHLRTVPKTFTLAARNRARSLYIGADDVVFTSVGGPAYVMDNDRGRRDGTHAEMCDYLKVIQSLNIIHQEGGGPFEPMDLPANTRHLDLYRAQITILDKSWQTQTLGRARTMDGLILGALALGLSKLGAGRSVVETLFIDEGFGTLDPEALELVAGILESLPTRGRLVGVVTHVEALAERFPARLRVRKHPWGSRVEWA